MQDTPADFVHATLKDLGAARRRAGQIAMADLLGYSVPPEGVADNYPFNAVAFMRTLPEAWQDEVHEVIVFTYHNERTPRPDEV